MATLIRGIDVTLYERTQTGTDALGAPIYSETPVTVENVIVTPAAAEDVIDDLRRYGKRSEYELCIPKGDSHRWEDSRVDFFGSSFRVFAPIREYIDDLVPLDWNRKVRVERYE